MNELKDNKKNNLSANIKASFSGRKLRSGAYVTAMSAVVIIIVLVVNMLFTKMNLQVDLSSQNMYTLSKDTKTLVKDLKDDITIYYLVQTGNETDLFINILKQYDTASDKVKVEYKDPVLYPNFASKYVSDTVQENSFLVVDNTNNKAKYVDYNDVLVQEVNYQTYQQETTGIDVEGELTSAIQFVTATDLSKMYVVEGHGEAATGNTFNELVKKMNVSTEALKTVSADSIPEDCDELFINAPQTDFSDAETKLIKDYLTNGGKAIITLDYNAEKLANFQSILEYYGIQIVQGIVLEGDGNMHMSNYIDYLMPNLSVHDITSKAYDKTTPVFMPVASGLKVSDQKRSSLTIEPLMTTSDSAYSKVDTSSSTVDKEDGDIEGPFNLGMVATDTFNNVQSSIIVYGSAYTFSDDTATYSNPDLLTGTVGYFTGDNNLLSIPTKSLASSQVSMSQNQVIMIGAMVVLVIPIAILIFGGVICYKRRKR